MQLYPYQAEAAAFHLEARYSLNFSEQGTGKTWMALAAAKASGHPVKVFGPAFLRSNWKAEAEAFGVEVEYHPYTQIPVTASPDAFWICDEVHALKNPTAQRTDAFYSLLKETRPAYFLGLTGTPIKNRVPDLWTLLAFCAVCPKNTNGIRLSETHPRYYAFARHFCTVQEMKIRGRKIEKFIGLKPEREAELKALLSGKAIRFRVDQVLKHLPPMISTPVRMEIDGAADGLAEAFDAYMSGSKADAKAKHLSAQLKAPLTAQYCLGLLEGGSGPLVVFTDYVGPAESIGRAIKGALIVTGKMDGDDRAAAVALFQKGNTPALVATIGALSVGVTLTAARHVVFNDLSWVPGDNAQAEKRIHRIGQALPCQAHYIEASPTDAYIRKTLVQKLEAVSKAIS